MNTMTKGDFMRRINRRVREAFAQAAQNPENTVRSREEGKKTSKLKSSRGKTNKIIRNTKAFSIITLDEMPLAHQFKDTDCSEEKQNKQKQNAGSNYLLSSRNTRRGKRHPRIESQRRGQPKRSH